MSDEPTTTEAAALDAADDPAAATEPDTEDTDTTTDDSSDDGSDDRDTERDNASREAAKYRRKLRATEQERDHLAARLQAMQRNEVERLAATVLTDPGDIWVAGTQLTDLLGDQGDLDPAKVKATLDGITETRPHWRKPARRPATLDGQRSGASGNQLPSGTSWAQALQQAD